MSFPVGRNLSFSVSLESIVRQYSHIIYLSTRGKDILDSRRYVLVSKKRRENAPPTLTSWPLVFCRNSGSGVVSLPCFLVRDMSKEYQTGTIESRRKQASNHSQELYEHYRECWDVQHIADVEENRQELTDTHTRSITQLLECADIDTVVDTYDKQIAIQEKQIYSEHGNSLAIRIENDTNGIASEGERLRKSHTDSTLLTPTVIAYAKMNDGIEWVRLVCVTEFVEAWQEGQIQPDSVYSGKEVNTKLFFDPRTVDASGAVIYREGES